MYHHSWIALKKIFRKEEKGKAKITLLSSIACDLVS